MKPLLMRLGRVTSTRMYIPEIDGLRFLSILLVVLFHLRTAVLESGQFDQRVYRDDLIFSLLSKGGLGVNLFFTISGFVLALPLIKAYLLDGAKFSIGRFYLRRITRLEPPYLIIMTVLFLGQILFFEWSFEAQLPHYLSSITYVHFVVYDAWSTVNPVAWSLETEVQFYLIAPFLGYIFMIKRASLRIAIGMLAVAFHLTILPYVYAEIDGLHLSKSVIVYFSNFCLGFVLADIFVRAGFLQNSKVNREVVNDIVGVAGIAGVFYFYYNSSPFASAGFIIGVTGLFYGAFRGKFMNRIFRNAWIATIGGMCYTIYLVHYIFLFLAVPYIDEVVNGLNFYLYFCVAGLTVLPLLFILSVFTFLVFEKPFMYPDWTRRVSIRVKRILDFI